MTTRAEHLAEMRVALERRCSLAEAKAYLVRTRHWAGEAALRKVRGEAQGRVKAIVSQPPANAWWLND